MATREAKLRRQLRLSTALIERSVTAPQKPLSRLSPKTSSRSAIKSSSQPKSLLAASRKSTKLRRTT
jgi:hypothetical protein